VFEKNESISSNTTIGATENYTCPARTSGLYVNDEYKFSTKNTATIDGLTTEPHVRLRRGHGHVQAVWYNETATGRQRVVGGEGRAEHLGHVHARDRRHDDHGHLIAGQHHAAGDVATRGTAARASPSRCTTASASRRSRTMCRSCRRPAAEVLHPAGRVQR
jgi:hypothetical protein